MYDLLDGMAALRKSMIFLLFAICLQNSGLLTIWTVKNTNQSSSQINLWLQPHGLSNGARYSSFDSATNWIHSGTAFNVFIPVFVLLHFMILCYFVHVFLTYRVVKIIKYVFLFVMTIEIIVWICIMLAYWFSFQTFWDDEGEKHVSILVDDEGPSSIETTCDECNLFWTPDYGIVIYVLILYYMLRIWWRIIRAM